MSYNTKVYMESGGDRLVASSGGSVAIESGGSLSIAADTGLKMDAAVRSLRVRATTAEVNAGLLLLAALAGYKYRIVDMTMIAIGGNAATATSVDIVTTQGGSAARPYVVAVAALTRSAVVKPNSANVTVLADGASHVANDANTGVYISKQAAGSNLATATHIDLVLSYTIEAA